MNPISLIGKHAIVTGASGDIGAAIARVFAHHGARLTLIGRNDSKLRAALNSLPPPDKNTDGDGPAHRYVIADVTKEGSFRDIVKAASAESKVKKNGYLSKNRNLSDKILALICPRYTCKCSRYNSYKSPPNNPGLNPSPNPRDKLARDHAHL